MENTNLIIEKNLNFFQRIRKQLILNKISPYKYKKKNFPKYLKNDVDILNAMVEKFPHSFNIINRGQQRMLMQYNPEIFLRINDNVDRDSIVRENPEAIFTIFDKLPSKYKVSFLKEHPDYLKKLNTNDALSYIFGGSDNYFEKKVETPLFNLIEYLPENIQVELLTKNTQFVDRVRNSNYLKVIQPDFFKDKLEYFFEKSVIEAVTILTEMAKKETREEVPLLKNMKIHNFPLEMQQKLLLIDNELVNQLSTEAIIQYIDNNPLIFLEKLNIEKQLEVLKQKPEFFRVLNSGQKARFLKMDSTLKDIIPDIEKLNYISKKEYKEYFCNVEEIKMNIIQENIISNPYYVSKLINYVSDEESLIELIKFEPCILTIGIWDNEKSEILQKIEDTIGLYKRKTNNPDILKALEDFKFNLINWSKTNNILDKMNIITAVAKVFFNENVMSKIKSEVIADFIKDPNIEKMKNIIVETYGEHAKKIFEDRPNISMNQIQNLFIFDEKVIEKFGIGVIHDMLSYNSRTSAIIGELVRHPEKMEKFENFSEITGDYFDNTPLALEKKLVSFYKMKQLFSDTKFQDFTPERGLKLLTAINDINMTEDINETGLLPLENLEDLDKYEQNRNKIYDNAIKQLERAEDVKELLFRNFFGIIYGNRVYENYCQSNITVKDMLRYYNLKSFVSDERTIESELFTEEELDQLELFTIIDEIKNTEVLKELYNFFNERREEILGPIDFNSIKSKIPEQYSNELVDSLFKIEDAKKRAEEGENGISYIQTEDGYEIIQLHGADFRIFMHTTGLNYSHLSFPANTTLDENWKYFEEGCSTISGCVIEPEMLYSCAMKEIGEINFGFSNFSAKQIIGMSHHDAHVSHIHRKLDPDFNYLSVEFNYPDELIRKTAAQITGQETQDITHKYNEVAMYRRNINYKEIKNGMYGGKIMPDYIVVYGEINDIHKEMAKKFSINNKPIPIVQIDITAYLDKTYERGSKRENHVIERKKGKIIEEITDVIDM